MRRRLIGTVVGDRLVVTDGQEIQRLGGVLEDRCAPMMKGSDRAFLENRHDSGGLDGLMAQRYRDKARAAGININGKVYLGTLADKRGAADPGAWVSGLDDVRDVCRQRGYGSEDLGLKPVEPLPTPSVRLAEDIVDELVAEELVKDPTRAETPKKLETLRHEVVEKHGAPTDG